jgi:hypothetical protein
LYDCRVVGNELITLIFGEKWNPQVKAQGKERETTEMKKLITAGAIIFLLSIPIISYAQQEQNVQGAASQSLFALREGGFAVKLAEVLKLGAAKNETEAESLLGLAGISPKNGWIADYPLTPEIVGEVRRAIAEALDSGKLAMKKEEAFLAVQILVDSLWKPVGRPQAQPQAASGGEQARTYGAPPATASGPYDPYYSPDPY